MKKNVTNALLKLAPIVLAVAGTTFNCLGTTVYWNGNVSQAWTDPNNFQASGSNLPGVPQAGDTVYMESWAAQTPLLNGSGYASINDIYISKGMTIAGGGVLNTTFFKLGWDATGTLNVTGGSLTAGNHLDVGGYSGGTATMNVSGGSITVGGLYFDLNNVATGASYLNLTGGTLTDNGVLSINSTHPSVLNINGGTLVVPNSQLGNVNYWIGSGNITGPGGGGASTLIIDTVSDQGFLVITAAPEPATDSLLVAGVVGFLAFGFIRRRSKDRPDTCQP